MIRLFAPFAPDAARRCYARDFVFRLCDLLRLERRFRLLSAPKTKGAARPGEDEGGEAFYYPIGPRIKL